MMLEASVWQYAGIFATAFILAAILIPQNIRFSRKYNILATPNSRSIHVSPIPTAGGLSFGLVIILMQSILGWLNINNDYGISLLKLSGISLLLIALGLFDDKYQSRVRYKLVGQILIALMMFYAGYRVTFLTNPLGSHFQLGWVSLPITLIWFLLTMNAMNLIDGLDGLAAGITCIVSIVLAIVGMISGNPLVLTLTAILLGTNLAFLRYNFFPAKIFMGDTGSLLIGLNIAAISTAGNTTFKGITTMTMMVPVIALAIPFIDTVLAVFRRIGKGSIFRADKAHLHHYLLKLGLSQKSIALISYFITCLFGLAAIGFSFSSKKILFSLVVLLMAVLIVLAYYIIHRGQK
jgi:UDP-GlcNAc:undecaprenyl-phosphate GlcNAc-1-phosphate transferase